MNKSLEFNFLANPVRQYRLLMFMNTRSVSKTDHNWTQRRKLVKSWLFAYVFIALIVILLKFISYNVVATQFGCGGIFTNYFLKIFHKMYQWNFFWKFIKIW